MAQSSIRLTCQKQGLLAEAPVVALLLLQPGCVTCKLKQSPYFLSLPEEWIGTGLWEPTQVVQSVYLPRIAV
jgi:hypothetical protein